MPYSGTVWSSTSQTRSDTGFLYTFCSKQSQRYECLTESMPSSTHFPQAAVQALDTVASFTAKKIDRSTSLKIICGGRSIHGLH